MPPSVRNATAEVCGCWLAGSDTVKVPPDARRAGGGVVASAVPFGP